MPDTFTETLRAVALNIGVPALIVLWYACRVRHPARPRWQAFLMALAVLATVPAATLAGLHYAITVRDGSPLILIPVGIALPFVLRAIVRAWLRSAPRRRARPRSIRSQPGRRNPPALNPNVTIRATHVPIRPAITARNGPKTSIRRATTCDPNRSGPAPKPDGVLRARIDYDCSSFVTLRLTAIRPQRAGGVTRRAAAQRRTAQPLTRPARGGIRAFVG